MLREAIDQLGKTGLDVTLQTSTEEIRVGISGSCDHEGLPHLQLFLNDLDGEARRTRAKQVIVDCENLYFMSSASIRCLVGWIGQLKQAPTGQRYTVEFRVNKRLPWQERSLSAIIRFAPEIARVV
jgi:anti-anti-sigma factor